MSENVFDKIIFQTKWTYEDVFDIVYGTDSVEYQTFCSLPLGQQRELIDKYHDEIVRRFTTDLMDNWSEYLECACMESGLTYALNDGVSDINKDDIIQLAVDPSRADDDGCLDPPLQGFVLHDFCKVVCPVHDSENIPVSPLRNGSCYGVIGYVKHEDVKLIYKKGE